MPTLRDACQEGEDGLSQLVWLNQLMNLINGDVSHYLSQGADYFSVDFGPWHIQYDKAKGETK